MQEFKGRVAVVTGSASGMGLAMATRFASEGMKVVMADIHEASLEAAAAKLRATGATVIPQVTNVSQIASVEALAERAYAEFGAVNILCNNAGVVGPDAPSWEQSLATWEWLLGVNLWGVIHGIKAFLPRMIAGGEEGHVVNTASMAGVVMGGIGSSPYDASKHAVVALTESLYRELAIRASKVSASVLCPGAVNTPIYANSERDQPEKPGPEQRRTFVGDLSAFPDVFPPERVAGQVFDAINEGRFYIFAAQPEMGGWMKMRHDRMLDGRNPAVPRRSLAPRTQ